MNRFLQGKYKPTNPQKYKGDVNNIIFRSSWELAFLKWLDKTPGVIKYSSEEVIIPYVSPKDQKVHRYFPDFLVTMQTNKGTKTFLIEIKPYRQTIEPKIPKRKTKNYLTEIVTYCVNKAKWESARNYCELNDLEFRIITEKDMFGFK